MVKQRKAQAAFEYLTTYGWAVLTALVAIGALAYFGFLNPNNLLPNRCDFGKQLECVEYRIRDEGALGYVDLQIRNNFGKDINITEVAGEEIVGGNVPPPLSIRAGDTEELILNLNIPFPAGEKKEVSAIIVFMRNQAGATEHNISGTVFVTVQ